MQVITLKIGSANGRDYTSPRLAWAATPNDWVAADVSYIFEMYSDSEYVETAPWSFSGKTLDATHNLVVRPAAGQSFKDNANVLTNALRYNPANGVAVNFNIGYSAHISISDYVAVEGLQIKSSGLGGVIAVALGGTTGTSLQRNNLIEFAGNNSLARAVQIKTGSVWNTQIILTGVQSTGVYQLSGGAIVPSAENVTVTRLSSLAATTMPAFNGDNGSFKIKNCAAFGCGPFSTRSDFTGSNNASDGTILFGTNNKTNLVYVNQFVDTVTDFRVKAGSALIDAGVAPSAGNTITISGVRQQGTSADIGAWEYLSNIQAPTANVTSVTVTNQTVVVKGSTTGVPTTGKASLVVVDTPYNSGVSQIDVAISLSSGAFTATFNSVKAGRYSFNFTVANANYSVTGTNTLGSIDVVGPRALSVIQDAVTPEQVLTIRGTVEKATSGQLVIPASASNSGVTSQTVGVTIDTSVTPNTFIATAALPSGSYDAPVLTFTGPAGTSMPQAGTQAITVIGPRALSVVQDPIDGQTLTIHGTVEKATSGQLTVPADSTNANGAIAQYASVDINTTVTPNTFTISIALPSGNYAAPVLTFSNYLGQSQPQAGTSAISIVAINGSPQAPMPSGGTAPDTNNPVMIGVLSKTNISTTGFTVSWQAATDDVGIAYYEVSTDGVNYQDVGNVLTYTKSDAEPSTTYDVKVRAVDTSANRASTPLSTTVVTPDPVVTPSLSMTGTITANNITATGFDITWSAAVNGVGVVTYEYSVSNGDYKNAGTSLFVSLNGLVANTSYPVQVRAVDSTGNKSAPLVTTVKTAANVSYTGFSPSSARTISVLATTPVFTGGKWWTLTDAKRPRGLKDPDAIIDITFDWSDWLNDIGSPTVSDVIFTLNGLSSVGTFSDGTKTTVFVSGGTAGSATAISCKIKTLTAPARTVERTVYIDVAEE